MRLIEMLVSMAVLAFVLTLLVFIVTGMIRFIGQRLQRRNVPFKTYPQFKVRKPRSKRNKMIWLVVFFLLWGMLVWLYGLVVQGIQF